MDLFFLYGSRRCFLFFVLLTVLSSITHAAVETPATLIVSGTIEKGTIAASQNDRVYAVQANGQIESIGSVQDSSGFYVIQISKTTDFNGTELSLQLEHAGTIYQLLDNGNPASFIFSGGFFPVTLSLDLSVGIVVGGSIPNTGSTGGTGSTNSNDDSNTGQTTTAKDFDSRFDVDGDGQFTQSDVDAVKNAVAHNTKLEAADINSDGQHNTRDIIESIKAYIKYIKLR